MGWNQPQNPFQRQQFRAPTMNWNNPETTFNAPTSPAYDPFRPDSPEYDPNKPMSPEYDPNKPMSPEYDPNKPMSPEYDPNKNFGGPDSPIIVENDMNLYNPDASY